MDGRLGHHGDITLQTPLGTQSFCSFFTIKVFILKQTYKYNFILLPPGGFDPWSLGAMRLYEANAITIRPLRPTAMTK